MARLKCMLKWQENCTFKWKDKSVHLNCNCIFRRKDKSVRLNGKAKVYD